MKKLLILYILFAVAPFCYGQYPFGTPTVLPGLNCHVNVHERPDQAFRDDLKRAVFKLTTSFGNCSGTLVNRNTGQNDLGQYFITAWHCFKSGTNCGGNEQDFNQPLTFTFNYQSPNMLNTVFQDNDNGRQYQITRQVRLVDKFVCAYGDFALCEILGPPIPPHFNPYFAGWYPNEILLNRQGDFAAVHHPGGSIKKISSSNHLGNVGAVKGTCRVITKVIDFLFGWIWKRRWSTQVICTYVQAPLVGTKYMTGFQWGKMEDGSSGGGLFTGPNGSSGANRFVGDLSATFPGHTCNGFIDFGISHFGKFADSYYRQSVKNTLNPPNKYWIDQGGIPGRQISCYPQLAITAEGTGFNLYPANLYQPNNNITLTSQTTTYTNGVIRVMNGADFNFIASQAITFNPGFEVQAGAIFNAALAPSPCFINNGTYRAAEGAEPVSEYDTDEMNKLLAEMPYPEEKVFDINKYLPAAKEKEAVKTDNNVGEFNIYPNPSRGTVNVKAFFREEEKMVAIEIYDLNGRKVYSKNYRNIHFINEQLATQITTDGIYNVIIRTASQTISKKLVVTK
jgi:hypothetical protein